MTSKRLGLGLIPIALPLPLLALLLSAQPGNSYTAKTLSPYDVISLQNLAWPQSYEAMIERFGSPAYADQNADYYSLPSGGSVAVTYVGRRAHSALFIN